MGSTNDATTKDLIVTDENTPLLAASDNEPPPQANEEQPLLDSSARQNGHDDATDDDEKPLPFTQILLLCYARLTEPIAFFCIFPFINEYLYSFHLKEEDVGFYSGLIVSSLARRPGGRVRHVIWRAYTTRQY